MQVLVSSMFKNADLYKTMNIQTNAIIINQQDKDFNKIILEENDNKIEFYNMSERGVGLSRNNALMRASDDIVIMADDDEVFVDGYEEIINSAYQRYPDADMIVFDVRIHKNNKTITKVKKTERVHFFNSLRYGTVTFTFKKETIIKNNIFFSQLFGGGAKFQSGEDSIFLTDVLRKGLKVYSVKQVIADVYNDDSSWFAGYNKDYLIHRGALFEALSKRYSFLLMLQFAIRKKKLFPELSIIETIKLMNHGKKIFKNKL